MAYPEPTFPENRMQIPALNSVTVEILVDNFFDVFEPSKPGLVERVAPGRLPKPLIGGPRPGLLGHPDAKRPDHPDSHGHRQLAAPPVQQFGGPGP